MRVWQFLRIGFVEHKTTEGEGDAFILQSYKCFGLRNRLITLGRCEEKQRCREMGFGLSPESLYWKVALYECTASSFSNCSDIPFCEWIMDGPVCNGRFMDPT